jgi:rRNA maturation endonuclease Nob1
MHVLARIKNKEGKTLLVYASELHRIKLMGELINFNADVSALNQSTDAVNTHIICKSCGEELEGNVKFCKFCGKKI